MRNPLARYYDFAVQPRHANYARFWLILPAAVALVMMFALAWTARHGVITNRPILRGLTSFALAMALTWIGYVALRTAVEIFAAGRWVKHNLGPTWTSGWRAAWRVLFGRSGKTD